MEGWKVVALTVLVFLGAFFATNVSGDNHPKPTSQIEFGIEKHGGLHYVHGGFDVEKVNYKSYNVGVFRDLKAVVNINSLWTYQADASKADDPKRTRDLLSKDWFHARKFERAYAYIKWLPVNDAKNVKVKLTIKGRTKVIIAEVKGGKLRFRIKLKDFNINNSWKSIFAGSYADVVIKIHRVV